MPQRRDNPELVELILVKHQEGKGCWVIGRELGIARSTVRWHILRALDRRPVEPLPDERPICFVCHAPCKSWDGHDACRGRKAA